MRNMTTFKVLALIVTIVALALDVPYVSAQSAPPHVFIGKASVNGLPAPNGTVITAWIKGVEAGSTSVSDASGNYGPLAVYSGGTTIISFTIGALIADQTAWWERGGASLLDLTVSSPNEPTPIFSIPAGLAVLSFPQDVEIDQGGNLYVALGVGEVAKLNSAGVEVWRMGSIGTGDGQFGGFFIGLTVDGEGNVYVADTSNDRIQKFSPQGEFLLTWGSSGAGDGQLNAPTGVTVDGAMNVYVADNDNNRIQKFDHLGRFLLKFGSFCDLGTGEGCTDPDGSGPLQLGDGQFNHPSDLAADVAGNLYTVDIGNGRMQKFNPQGEFLSKWGSPGSGDGNFNQPNSAAVDLAGNVYVVDNNNTRIQKFDFTGGFVLEFGSGGIGDGQFGPISGANNGVAVDLAGNVFVADSSNARIQKFDSTGNFMLKFGNTGKSEGQFQYPLGVGADGIGNVYVADTFNDRIQKFSPQGEFLLTWGSSGAGDGQLDFPTGVVVDGAMNVYVADAGNNRIQKFDHLGRLLLKFGSFCDLGTGEGCTDPDGSGPLQLGDGQFWFPSNLAVDMAGNVYVADENNQRIQKFSPRGAFLLKWSSMVDDDGQVSLPSGVAVDGAGNIYVADEYNNRIQKFDPRGTRLLEWGSQGSGEGQFVFPRGVAVDDGGDVYVSDKGNNRIQKFSPQGTFILKWGSPGTGDDQFYRPTSVFVNRQGKVYVADTDNHRVQVFGNSALDTTFEFLWPITPEDRELNGDGIGISGDYANYGDVVSDKHHVGLDTLTGPEASVLAASAGRVFMIQENGGDLDPNIPCHEPLLPDESSYCEDHGYGNTIIIEHTVSTDIDPGGKIYTHYSHLESIRQELITGCRDEADPNRAKRRTCDNVIAVVAGEPIGQVGKSCYGVDCTVRHLHFEVKTFPTLAAISNDCCDFGYTTQNPGDLGYFDPLRFLHDIPQIPPDMISVGNRVGITNSGQDVGLRMGPGKYTIQGSVNAGQQFVARRTGPATADPSCSMGWYQVFKTENPISPPSPDDYFTDITGGKTPDAWICRGNAGEAWVGAATQTGINVQVAPTEGVSVAFQQIAGQGITSVDLSASNPGTVSGIRFLGTFYDVITTADYTGTVTVCLDYDASGMAQSKEENLRVFHWDGLSWLDVTASLDTGNDNICATVPSLSWFAIGEVQPIGNIGEPSFDLYQDPTDAAIGFKVDITRVFDSSTNEDVNIDLESFQAGLTYPDVSDNPAFPPGTLCVNILDVREMDFSVNDLNIEDVLTGTTFNGVDPAGVPWPTDLGHALTRLNGSANQQCIVDLEMTSVTDTEGNTVAVPPLLTQLVQRGDARADGNVTIDDALFIAEYLVGSREGCTTVADTTCLHSVNAASVRQDGAIDQITIADALNIAQHLAGLRDESYNLVP